MMSKKINKFDKKKIQAFNKKIYLKYLWSRQIKECTKLSIKSKPHDHKTLWLIRNKKKFKIFSFHDKNNSKVHQWLPSLQ